jgi:hypothetical protein
MSTFARKIKDAEFVVNRALPTADGTVTSADFDFESAGHGFFPENTSLIIEVPELTSTNLPNADTLTITVQGGSAATPTTSLNIVRVITGAGGVGASAVTWFIRLPSDCPRYINVKFVAAGGTGDISASTATVALRY